MTTSTRATYHPARGREGQGGYKRWTASGAVSVLELPSHTTIKRRNVDVELALLDGKPVPVTSDAEEPVFITDDSGGASSRDDGGSESQPSVAAPPPAASEVEEEEPIIVMGAPPSASSSDDASAPIALPPPNVISKEDEEDEDDPDMSDSESSSDDDDDDDSDSDDETAILMQELAKIRAERAEKARVEEARDILTSNPLLRPRMGDQAAESSTVPAAAGASAASGGATGTFLMKRKWDDYCVFKNQAIGRSTGPTEVGPDGQPARKRRRDFINDPVRNHFHKDFLDRHFK